MKKSKRYRRNKKRIGLRAISIGVVALILVIMAQAHFLEKKSQAQAVELDRLSLQFEKEQQRTTEIEELSQYMQTKKFMEEEAKDKLGLVYPGEIIFKSNEE